MPELPEVETMRRNVAAAKGCAIVGVERPRCRLRPIAIRPRFDAFRRRAVGRTIVAVERAGKRIVLTLSDEQRMVIEPRMTGLVLLAEPPDAEHLRLRLMLRGKTPELLFWDRRGLGTVSLLQLEEYQARLGNDKLGPDALLADGDILRTQLGRSRRAIKVALLDQKALAGVGNLYAAEILFRAHIHPATPCQWLNAGAWESVALAMRRVLGEAIHHEGSTLADGTYRKALNQAGGYQVHHRVYARAGQRCLRCNDAEIVRIVQAQRATFYCPSCQPLPRGRRVPGD
jgi:formamidopyrimidine-DNA glycosylase